MFQAPAPDEQEGQGWTRNEDGHIEPLWFSGEMLPPSLADIYTDQQKEDSTDEEADDDDGVNEEFESDNELGNSSTDEDDQVDNIFSIIQSINQHIATISEVI